MKRKFKLFATVASLCLCLALMAFGVYAASSVTYTASGSVKYVVTDVFADFKLEVFAAKNSVGHTRSADSTISETNGETNYVEFNTETTTEKNGQSYSDQKSYEGTSPTDPGASSLTTGLTNTISVLDFAKSDVYKIVITITNKAKSGSIKSKAVLTEFSEGVNADIVAKEDDYDTNEKTAQPDETSNTIVYTYYVYLLDPAKTIEQVNSKDPGFTITVTVRDSSISD